MRKVSTVIAVTAAFCAFAGLGIGMLSPYSRGREPARETSVTVAGEVLTLPVAYFRPEARSREDSGSVELAAFFPDFKPAGQVDDVTAHTDLKSRFERIVFISVKPAEGRLAPSEQTARLYQRFLEDGFSTHPGGLIARAFQGGSPFEGNDLYSNSLGGTVFAALCRRPDPTHKTPDACLAVFRTGPLDVEVRFASEWLGEWSKMMAGARGLIEAARR